MATILIIDDRPINREFLSMLLGYAGHRVLEAEHGAMALDILSTETLDIIITDIVMPIMDGITFVKTVRANPAFATIPIILYTATYHMAEARALADSGGIQHIIYKPSEPQIILDILNSILKMKPNKQITQQQSFQEKIAQLEKVNLSLSMLMELSLDMSAQLEDADLLYMTCIGGNKLLDTRYMGIILLDKEEGQSLLQEFWLVDANECCMTAICRPELKNSLLSALLNKRLLCKKNVAIKAENIGLPNPSLSSFHFLGVALSAKQNCHGICYFIDKLNGNAFDEHDQRLALALADKLAIIIEQKKLQKLAFQYEHRLALAELARISSMGEIASILAHELNQPLATITTFTQGCIRKLQAENYANIQVLDAMRTTAQEAERAGAMVHRMKNFVSRGELVRECISVNTLIRSLMLLIKYEARNTVIKPQLELASALPSIYADRIQIEQVLINLTRNAIEAMKEANTSDPCLIIRTAQTDGKKVAISIIDNGPGFNEENIQSFFNPYITTKHTGTGMGLAISRTIVEAHGGQLFASHNPMDGTCFCLTLPY